MSTISIAGGKPPIAALALRPIVPALLVTAVLTAVRLSGSVDADVAWQLWIAARMDAGAQLYRDIVEVNPPLWFWMALPVDRAATLLHARPEAVLVTGVGIAVALSLAATDRLIRHIPPLRRALLLIYAALLLIAAPWLHIGQREQLLLVGTVPYVALIAARRNGAAVPPSLAILVGAGSALGFALKHYFLLVPALLELWLFASSRREWRCRRPELAAMVATGALYACAVVAFAPDFLRRVVPMVVLGYGDSGAANVWDLFGPFLIVGLLPLAFVAMQVRLARRRSVPLTMALLVAAVALAAVYFIQAKGWRYHAIPLIGCSSLALAAFLAERPKPSPATRIFAPALLLLPLALSVAEAHARYALEDDLQDAISGMQPGDTLGFIGVENAIPWSVMLQHGFRNPSRYMSFWMLPAIAANEHRRNPDPRLVQLGRQIAAETADDFGCLPPKRIIVQRPPSGEAGFDILTFFQRDPHFAELLTHYRVRSRTSMESLDRVSLPPFPPRTRCHPGF
jgi:hypothetical protein